MKKILIIIAAITGLLYLSSCGMKEECERNNTGFICVKNYSGNTAEVFVNDIKVFTLSNETENCVTRPVGNHSVKFIYLTNENTVEVSVEQCKETYVNVSF
ncbi:MAG: hypothetical protein GX879_06775 [Bacteroidales bacterium]|nr:hypothetical protein [Bacteroidales bacterium]